MLTRSDLEWLMFAVAAAIAARLIAVGGTPLDRSLPFVAVLLLASGWIARVRPVQMSAPLLLSAAMFLPDERTRLLAYGVIGAAALSWAVIKSAHILHVVTGVMLLRWVPVTDVAFWREIVVLAGAAAVYAAVVSRAADGQESPPLHSIVAALAIAIVTPNVPGRMLLFPFVVAFLLLLPVPRIVCAIPFAIAAVFARYSIATLCFAAFYVFLTAAVEDNRPRLSVVRIPLYATAIALFALWPWSGIVARAMPRFLAAETASPGERPVWVALEAGRSVSMDAPPDAHLIVLTASGANASGLRGGRVVGWAEVVGRNGEVTRRDLRIGDIADFGFTRREHFFASRNPVPAIPLDDVHEYGIAAWLHTAGRVGLISASPVAFVRVTAAADLPPATKLQVETVEFE